MGLCMPFLYPARLLRIRKRKKQGTWRDLPHLAQNLDDFEPQAATEFVLVKQILPSRFPVFSLTDSIARSKGTKMACTAPQGDPAHLSLSWAHPAGRKERSPSEGRLRREMRMVRAWVGRYRKGVRYN